MNLVEVGSLIFGASGVGLAAYQVYKRKESEKRQKKLENQIERKEELQDLAEDVKDLKESLDLLQTYLLNPLEHEDMWFALRDISRDMLVYNHSNDDVPKISLSELTTGVGDQKEVLGTPEEVLNAYKKGTLVFTKLQVSEEQNVYLGNASYDIHHVIMPALHVFECLRDIDTEYADLIDKFDSSLTEDVRDATEDIVCQINKNLLQKRDGVEFDPGDYESTEDITDHVYRTFVLPEEIKEEVKDLDDLIDRVGEVQTSIMIASS